MRHAHCPTPVPRAIAFALLAMCACARVPAAEPDGIVAAPPTHAIWLSHNVPFKFRSDKTSYTCPMFKEKVRDVLVAVGVHASLIVELRCDSDMPMPQPMNRGRNRLRWTGEVEATPSTPTYISGTSSHITTRIALAVPALANEENIRLATTFDAEQQLTAKAKNEPLPTPTTISVFPAVWTSIQLKSKDDFRLEASDCDLLRQLSQQVLPTIGVKVTRKLSCTVAKIAKPQLNVEALMPIYATPTAP